MSKQHILAIDQGTTGSTALLMNTQGTIIEKDNQEFKQYFPENSWVEHDPKEILNSVKIATKNVLANSGVKPSDIACIGITNQRETTVAWHKNNNEPVMNAIVWQCKRTAAICQSMKKQVEEKWLYQKTGLLLDPYFSASKMKWILEYKKPSLDQLAFGTIDSWLIYQLTGGAKHVTEPSNASRTLLCDLNSGTWDQELLQIFGIPLETLPEIIPSDSTFGTTKGLGWLPDGIPITGVLGDQQSALFGHGKSNKSFPKCTFGTGSFILKPGEFKAENLQHGVLSTIAWSLKGEITHACEGSSFIAGAAVQWLRDQLKIINKAPEIESLAKQCKSSDDVCFVPALSGLGSPYWRPEIKGLLSGFSRDTGRPQIARAVLEGIALVNHDILKEMDAANKTKTKSLLVDGGAVGNELLMQLQSDLIQAPVLVPKNTETTAYGAALIAGLGFGVWKTLEELNELNPVVKTYHPNIDQKETNKLKAKWEKNIRMLMS